jgi:hypothetical protein
MIVLSDRIKEISHSTGTGSFKLDGAATGFSAFSGIYSYNDAVYYAITDGVDYEVGSGLYHLNGSHPAISRFPFDSSNNDTQVNFGAGVKEVFVTYPGKYSVFTAGGLGSFQEPKPSGLAFWGTSQILCHDDNLTWNPSGNKLGISQSDPQYALDVGGAEADSIIRSSGMIIGDSGVMFSGVSSAGGRQIEPFLRTVLDATTGTDAVFSLSGIVNQGLLFQKQVKGTVLSGPLSGCIGGCSPDYPTFKYLTLDDIPDLSTLYTKEHYEAAVTGNVLFYKESGVYHTDPYFTWDKTNNRLGLNKSTPTRTLDVNGTAGISGDAIFGSDVVINENLTVSGTLNTSGNTVFDGNMTIRGTLDAHVADFKVTADTMTFGDTSSDNVIFNASTADIPNDLIFNGGNVGISGILKASGDVHIVGASAQLRIATPTTATDPSLFLSGGASTTEGLKLWYDYSSGASYIDSVFDNVDGDLYIRTKTAGTPVNAITIESAGNVGIGTTTPDAKFHVAGSVGIVGNTVASGTLGVSGVATLHGGLETYSGGLPAHTVINASGFLTIPGYPNEAAVIAALPPSPPHSGVLAVGGGTSIMWCDGTSWLSGVLA